VAIDAFRQKSFAPTLTPPRKRGAAAFGFHARAKSVLPFACPFRSLQGAFHNRRGGRAPTVKEASGLSMNALDNRICARADFL
jgi:hypothetical protein